MKKLLLIICLLITNNVFCQLGIVGGKVFHDINNNCNFDPAEQGLPYRMVKISLPNGNNPQYFMTDSLGSYSFKIPIRSLHMITLLKDTNNYRHHYTENKCLQNATFYVASDTTPKLFYNIPQRIILNNVILEKNDIDLIKTEEEYCIKNNNNKIKFFKIVNIYNQLIMSFSIEPNNQLFIKKPSSESILILYDLDGTFIKKL